MTFLRSTIAALAIALSSSLALAQGADNVETETEAVPDSAEPEAAVEPAEVSPVGIEVELNKLEELDGVCRAYFIIRNATQRPIETLELEIYLLDPQGIVDQRFALAFNAIRAGRTKVALFEFETACAAIGRMLVNDLYTCSAPDGPINGCAESLATTSRGDVPLEY